MNNCAGLYLLLAAGFSRRFGQAKQLYPLPSGHTIIQASINALEASGINFVVVVRDDDAALASHLKILKVNTITVGNAYEGLSSVIAEATAKLDLTHIEWLGVCLADMPYIKPTTLQKLTSHTSCTAIVRPRYLTHCGHPVLFGREYFSDLKALKGDFGAKAVIQANATELLIIDVNDAMVVHDIDRSTDVITP